VGFHEPGYDETEYARLVSARYGTRHHEVRLGGRDFAELLPRMIWHHDGPLNFANSLQIYAISRLAKDHVTVVLTGEGADELFLGYPRYLLPSLAARYRRLPPVVQRVARLYARASGDHRVAKIDRWAARAPGDALLFNASALDPGFAREVLVSHADDGMQCRRAWLREASAARDDPAMRLALLDQGNYLVSILERQDKMSMAASIESRVPFLDYRVVEFANRLPVDCKLNRWQTKAVLKKVALRFLPERVVHRRKSGFGVPLAAWLREANGLGRYMDELRDSGGLGGLLRPERLALAIGQHQAGEADHSEFLWAATNLMLWTRSLDA
jgi:asparagine synthase (glutamine-hydrolysing)